MQPIKSDSLEEIEQKLGIPMIILIAIACVAFVAILVTVLVCCCCTGDPAEVKELKIQYHDSLRRSENNSLLP